MFPLYVSHLLYPFICWWTPELLQYLSYCKYCCCDHWCACIFSNQRFFFYMPRNRVAGSHDNPIFNFWSKLHSVFQSGCTFTFLSTLHKSSLFFTSSPTFLIYRLFQKKIYSFIYFGVQWVFVAAHGFLQLQYAGFSLCWLLLILSTGSRVCGLQQLWFIGSQQLWSLGLVAQQHVGSSWASD